MMTKFETYQLFRKILSTASSSYDDDNKKIIIDSENIEGLKNELSQLSIHSTEQRGRLKIDRDNLPFKVFWTKEEYLNELRNSDLENDIAIFGREQNNFYYSAEDENTYRNFELEDSFLFTNAKVYFKTLKFLEEKYSNPDEDYEFVDFYSRTSRKIVFVSLVEKRRSVLEFPSAGIVILDEKRDYRIPFENFIGAFGENNKHLPKFIKTALVSKLSSENSNNLKSFFENLDEILKEAKLNFNLYLYELSIEKIKHEYQEYKEKYLSQFSSLLGKLSNQIIALPITILGAAYAINKVSDSVPALLIILFAIICITAFLVFIIRIHKQDLDNIEESVERDFKKLRESDFFSVENIEIKDEIAEELAYFEGIRDKLIDRVKVLKNYIRAYYIVMNFFNILLILYIAYNLIPLITEGQLSLITGGIILLMLLAILSFLYIHILR